MACGANMTARLIDIGCVRSANPARRELRVGPGPFHARLLEEGAWVRVALRDATELRCRVEAIRIEPREAVLTLTAGVTRDNVARMKGARVMIEAQRSDGESDAGYPVSYLEGLAVQYQDGNVLGMVADVYATEANAVIAVAKPGGGMLLIPVIDEVIAAVDRELGVVIVKDIRPYTVEDAD